MVRRLGHIVPVLLVAACATARPEPPVLDPVSRGLVALEAARWSEARASLGEAASRCESGRSGVDALLLLSTVELDPSNPGRDIDRAARYAAHVIALHDVDAVDLRIAQGLYMAALEGGAEPPRDPLRAAPGAAPRYSSCGEPAPATAARALPRHPGRPLMARLVASRARADSLSAVVDSVGAVTERVVVAGGEAAEAAPAVGDEAARLRSRVQALEAELARIRTLLRKGGG